MYAKNKPVLIVLIDNGEMKKLSFDPDPKLLEIIDQGIRNSGPDGWQVKSGSAEKKFAPKDEAGGVISKETIEITMHLFNGKLHSFPVEKGQLVIFLDSQPESHSSDSNKGGHSVVPKENAFRIVFSLPIIKELNQYIIENI